MTLHGKSVWIFATCTTDGVITEVGEYGGGPYYPATSENYWVAQSLCVGPDGAVWATTAPTGYLEVGLARSSLDGDITIFPTSVSMATTRFTGLPICAGPDGNLWFSTAGPSSGTICKMTTGGTVTQYTVTPVPNLNAFAMCAGSDGNIWFTGDQYVGKITTSGTVTLFEPPAPSGGYGVSFWGICSGPDGNLWVTENSQFHDLSGEYAMLGYVYEITPSADYAIYYVGPTALGAGTYPPVPLGQIAVGPDDLMWMSVSTYDDTDENLKSIDTSGTATTYTTTGLAPSSNAICSGPDGNLWVPGGYLPGTNAMFKVTPTGTTTAYPMPANWSRPMAVCAPSDGKIWFIALKYIPPYIPPVRMLQRSDGFGVRMRQIDGSGNAPSSLRIPAIGNAHV